MQDLAFPCGGLSWHECGGGARRAGTRGMRGSRERGGAANGPYQAYFLTRVGGWRRCRTARALWSAR